MADANTLASAADLLKGIGRFVVDSRTSDDGSFLAVECAEPAAAVKVYEIVVLMDPDAELIESTTGTHSRLPSLQLPPEGSGRPDLEALEALRADTAAKNAAVVHQLEAIAAQLRPLIEAADDDRRIQFAESYRGMLSRVERDLDDARAAVANAAR